MSMTRREIALQASQAARAKRMAARASKPGHKPGPASQFTIMPPVNRPEPAHAPDLMFPSELRMGLRTDAELQTELQQTNSRLDQLMRLSCPVGKSVIDQEGAQLRVNALTLNLEIQRRKVARCRTNG